MGRQARTAVSAAQTEPSAYESVISTPTLPQRIGRPPAFATHEAFEQAIDDYFADCRERKVPLTMSGLANALGVSRVTLMNYEHRDARFLNAVKRARSAVEQQLEEGLLTREKQVAGHIFNLKNNFGWRDTQEIEHTHTLVMLGTGEQPLAPPALTFAPSESEIRRNPSESLAITSGSHTADYVNLQVIDSTVVDEGR
jgi:hypothetical protein